MQPNPYLNEIRKEKDWLSTNRQNLHQKKEINKIPNGEFKFKPPKTIEDQLDELTQLCATNNYDKKIIIKGYKGTFKLEHWKMIELRLRGKKSIQSIKFIDTKLEKENLIILPIWFSWIQVSDLVLELQHNELDDECVEEFLFQIFERKINLSKLYIISNPGIYKGFLLRKLKHYLVKKYESNQEIGYLLIKNKHKLSIAIIRIQKNWQVQKIQEEKELAKKKIDQTFYFNLNLQNCFTNINWKGFEHLIQCTYNLDTLEQISSLDVSDNYLGTQTSFNNACYNLATAKGLITFKIKNQPLFHNTTAIQQLIGDRYDRFRVNHLDLSDNQNIIEKSFQLLAQHVLLECKSINLNNSLGENNNTLYKLSVLNAAYEQQNKQFEAEKKSLNGDLGKYRLKQKLQSLDLSKVENFNRYDQIEALLKNLIFTEYSNVRSHTFQNLDVGRTEIYCKVLNYFISEIESKSKIDKTLKNFKLNLRNLVLTDSDLEYSMKIDVFRQFFLDYLFTKEGSIYEAWNFKFLKSFTKKNRKEGLKEAAAYILEYTNKNQSQLFSINSVKFFQACMEMDIQTFKCFLLTKNIRLRTFKYFKDQLKGEGSIYLNELENFLTKQPEFYMHSLQIFKLDTVTGVQFDVCKLIKLFFYQKELQLKEFQLCKVSLSRSTLCQAELDQHIQTTVDPNRIFKLFTLTFGDLQGVGEEEFFKYIVFSKNFRLHKLRLRAINFNQLISQIGNKYCQKNKNTLEELLFLQLQEITISNRETWNQFSEIFIFKNKKLKTLIIKSTSIDDNFTQGLCQSAIELLRTHKNIQQNNDLLPIMPLKELKYIDCMCNSDFLSFFLPLCQIEVLEITKCTNLAQSLKKIRDNYIDQINTFAIKSFTLKECIIQDINLFEWLVINIALNFDRQQLETLNLINCELNDDMVLILCKQFQLILSKSTELKRIFSLRNLNLANNNQIRELQWVNLFNTVLNQNQKLEVELAAQDSLHQDQVKILLNENEELVQQSLLNIKQKIYYNNKVFKPNFPKQLLVLQLDMGLLHHRAKQLKGDNNSNQNYIKSSIYQRITTGFILYPESQLKELKLSNLDLDLFMECCKNSLEFTSKYFEHSSITTYRQQFLKIEKIDIRELTTQSKQSIEFFFNTFLCSEHINLKKLSLQGFREQFLQILLNLINNKSDFELEKFSIDNCDDRLNETQTLKFIEAFILGKKFQLKKLILPKGLIFDVIKQLELDEINKLTITKFRVSVEEKSRYHMQTINKILMVLFQGIAKIEDFEITVFNADLFVQSIIDSTKDQAKLFLKTFTINGSLSVDLDFFKFIQKSIDTLTLLKIYKVVYLKQNDQNTHLQQLCNYQKPKSKLDLNVIEHEDTYFFYYNLIFNEMFCFSDLILRNPASFANLQISYSILKIRYLKLDMGIQYNSNIQLDQDALSLLSKKMIFNEDSILEELVLMNCDFKLPTIKALTSPSQKLRDRILQTNKQKSFYLSLKRICILYSFHIGQDGMEALFKDLIYFEYTNIERIELQAIELNDKIVLDFIKHAMDWLIFQKKNQRQFGKFFPLRYLDIGKNELFQDRAIWQRFLRTFVFSDKAPYLEVLNLHLMALNDNIADVIAYNAQKFLNKKSSVYRFPLQRLNFSKNNFLTEKGWKNIFEQFIFHHKVFLIELNLTSTQLDSDEKLNAILYAAQKKAKLTKSKQLPLHTLLCYNVTLKNQISEYLSPIPASFQPPEDLPIKINYKCWKSGIYDEIPLHLGDQVEILNHLIYNCKELIISNKLDYFDCLKFSKFHLNFFDHYVKIINQILIINSSQPFIQMTLSLCTLDLFANLFRYTTEKPAKPYPYYMVFQKEGYTFFSNGDNRINRINLVQADSTSLEELTQLDVLNIWEQIQKNKCNIDQILMEYTIDDELIEVMLQKGYTERDFIYLCRLIPPSKVRIEGSLSLQAIKGLYSILYETYYFQYSVVDYKFDDFLNIGIGYGLRETAYQKVDGSGWSNFWRMIKYKFYDIFVKPTQKYAFDDSVIKLNKHLSQQKWYLILLAITNFLFFGSAIAGPIFLVHFTVQNNEQECQFIDNYYHYYCYVAFAFISAIVEGFLYFSICDVIPDFVEQMEHAVQYNELEIEITEYKPNIVVTETNRLLQNANMSGQDDNGNGENQFQGRYKKRISQSYKSLLQRINRVGKSKFVMQLNRIIQFAMSQLFKFDLFGDITFILVLQNCNYVELFYLTIAISALTQGVHFIYFLYLIVKITTSSLRPSAQLSSQNINDFYSIGFQGRNSALSNLLDSIAPYNVSVIPNNKLTKFLLPNQAGKSMSNLVKGYFLQFLFEDLPQIVIQTYFTAYQAWKLKGKLEVLTYLRIAISFLTVINSFIRFMSIRPTILVQDDFDKLCEKQKKFYKIKKLNYLEEEKKQLNQYTQYYSQPLNDQKGQNLEETNLINHQQSYQVA